jgi:hypothetical protein
MGPMKPDNQHENCMVPIPAGLAWKMRGVSVYLNHNKPRKGFFYFV